jgi:hypothetical protein
MLKNLIIFIFCLLVTKSWGKCDQFLFLLNRDLKESSIRLPDHRPHISLSRVEIRYETNLLLEDVTRLRVYFGNSPRHTVVLTDKKLGSVVDPTKPAVISAMALSEKGDYLITAITLAGKKAGESKTELQVFSTEDIRKAKENSLVKPVYRLGVGAASDFISEIGFSPDGRSLVAYSKLSRKIFYAHWPDKNVTGALASIKLECFDVAEAYKDVDQKLPVIKIDKVAFLKNQPGSYLLYVSLFKEDAPRLSLQELSEGRTTVTHSMQYTRIINLD